MKTSISLNNIYVMRKNRVIAIIRQ